MNASLNKSTLIGSQKSHDYLVLTNRTVQQSYATIKFVYDINSVCNQIDVWGPTLLWPDWAISKSFWLHKVAQNYTDFLGYFEKHLFKITPAVATFWATYDKIWAPFYSTSSHTGLLCVFRERGGRWGDQINMLNELTWLVNYKMHLAFTQASKQASKQGSVSPTFFIFL